MAAVAGVTPVKLDVKDIDHRYARVKPGDATQLQSAAAGPAYIIWKQSGAGTDKWAYVRLGNDDETFRMGHVSGPYTWNKDGSVFVDPIDDNGVPLPTGAFYVTNWFADVTVPTGENARVACHKYGDAWFLIAAECFT
jgi:hypothetical protein